MSGFQKLTPRQHQAVRFLLEGKTVSETAEGVGVTERTLFRWLAEPTFQSELVSAERKALENTSRRLLKLSEQAVDFLEQVLNSPAERGSNVRLRAVQVTLEQLVRVRELVELEMRVSELERQVLNGRKH
jgi:transposase-like protein